MKNQGKKKTPPGRKPGLAAQPERKNIQVKSGLKKNPPRYFFAVLFIIPVLFFLLLEFVLRLAGYGVDYPQWSDAGEGKYVINPELGKKYFTNVKFVPTTCEDVFDQEKKSNAFRVFVLGESSAAGYPFMPLGSFSRYIRKRLELSYPGRTIEVVNISMTGVSSYVLYDLIPGVLKQKPDLILIYAGHNEYYGALGVGSNESLGGSVTFVRAALFLNDFKITQLLRNIITSVAGIFSSEKKDDNGTLMSRMASDQSIAKDSEEFQEGIEQFRKNMRDILEMARGANVPVIIGNLVSNLKDQPPFIPVTTHGYKPAGIIFKEANEKLEQGDKLKADSLFRLAKDLDGLRFRAPEDINNIIKQLGKEFRYPVINIDSVFSSESTGGVTGSSLMMDHLHPTLRGYQLMGNAFYEEMTRYNLLPSEQPAVEPDKQDSLTKANFVFSELDSIIGEDIIVLLKNDWPFTNSKRYHSAKELFKLNTFLDSIALNFIENKITWSDAHLNAAIEYLRRDKLEEHVKHMNILVDQYPQLRDYSSALKYYYENNKINPRDFSLKRVGIIEAINKNYDGSIKHLEKSYQADPADKQVLYYLALAYANKKDDKTALKMVNKVLEIDPGYTDAKKLKAGLSK